MARIVKTRGNQASDGSGSGDGYSHGGHCTENKVLQDSTWVAVDEGEILVSTGGCHARYRAVSTFLGLEVAAEGSIFTHAES